MARIYQTVFEGPYPLAIAPEGQVSYSAERVLRLEPGPVRIGFHAAERLAEGGRPCPVELLPVSVQYRYGPLGKLGLYLLLRRVERAAGLKGQGSSLRERFRRCRESILAANEERYGLKAGDLSFEERLDRVIGAALEQAERILGVRGGEEEFFARLYRLRQICWDRIFLPEAGSLEGFSPVQRGILDLRAGEAWHAGRHLELADFAWYFRGPLPEDEGPLHIQVEYVQNLWDFASRSRGGAYSSRVNIPVRRAIIQTGPPLNLTERLGDYQRDRKAAVARALEDLKNRYLASAGTVSPAAKED
jgi:hypothetical protein